MTGTGIRDVVPILPRYLVSNRGEGDGHVSGGLLKAAGASPGDGKGLAELEDPRRHDPIKCWS